MSARVRPAPKELRQFLDAFPPDVAKLFLAARRLVLTAAPDANELVYDAYNAVSAAYSFSPRLKEAFMHVAAYSSHVNLGFNRGAGLPDPSQMLRGSGVQIRHIRLETPGDLKSLSVDGLIAAAVAQGHELVEGADGVKSRSRSVVRPTTGGKRHPKPRT